jgi:hypothetical protein
MSPCQSRIDRSTPPSGLRVALVLAALVLAGAPLMSLACQSREQSWSSKGYSIGEAQRVLQVIDMVEAASQQAWNGPLREVEVSESELNSYLAYRIEAEREEIMKSLQLKLFPDNKVEGMIHVDLRGQKVPSYIRPQMDIFFAADLLAANRAVKIDMKQLFVGKEPIQPHIIDVLIGISAALQKTEATSINDWYELPYGLKDVKVLKGKAVFYY